MKKIKFKLEFPLNITSPQIVWNLIGTSTGLSEWFSDHVEESGAEMVFHWDKYSQKAGILHMKSLSHIRLQWEEDKGSEYFFELKLIQSELSKDWTLFVTDFSTPDEIEESKLLWDQQIEELKRKLGL